MKTETERFFIKIQFSRISTVCGYGYHIQRWLNRENSGIENKFFLLESKVLHCSYGEEGYSEKRGFIEINAKTLRMLTRFLNLNAQGNYFFHWIEKEISYKRYCELRK